MRADAFAAAFGVCTAFAAWSSAQAEAPTTSPTAEPAPTPPPAQADPSPPPKPKHAPKRADEADAPVGKPLQLPSVSEPFAERWRGDVYASTGAWVSMDAGLGPVVTEGDPAISGSRRGTGGSLRAKVLSHFDHSWALGVRLAFDTASIPGESGGEWNTLEIRQTSFAPTLRWAPVAWESLEVGALIHAGGSFDSFTTTHRSPSVSVEWAGTSFVMGGGLELAFFPSSAFRQIELTLFAEAEVHSGGAKTKRPAYQDGGLPRTERATLRSGAGLGYHF